MVVKMDGVADFRGGRKVKWKDVAENWPLESLVRTALKRQGMCWRR